MGEISDGIGRDGEINHLDELPKVVAGSDGTELRMISVGYRCLGEIYIRYIRYIRYIPYSIQNGGQLTDGSMVGLI